VEGSSFGDGPITDDIPVKLDRIIHNRGPLPDHQVQTCDTAGVLRLGMAEGNFEQTFCNSEFVHGSGHYTAINFDHIPVNYLIPGGSSNTFSVSNKDPLEIFTVDI
jgi:hypothetical protein